MYNFPIYTGFDALTRLPNSNMSTKLSKVHMKWQLAFLERVHEESYKHTNEHLFRVFMFVWKIEWSNRLIQLNCTLLLYLLYLCHMKLGYSLKILYSKGKYMG